MPELPVIVGDEVSDAKSRVSRLQGEVYEAFTRRDWGLAKELAHRLVSAANDLSVSVRMEELRAEGKIDQARETLLRHTRHTALAGRFASNA